MSLQWTDELAIGQSEIDSQHRGLFEQFEAFLAACEERRGPEHLRELFGFLDDYVIRHFQDEEALMSRHGFPGFPRHREEHRIFRQRVDELRRELEKTGPTIQVLIRTNKALIYWLTTHIREVDRRFGDYLQEQP